MRIFYLFLVLILLTIPSAFAGPETIEQLPPMPEVLYDYGAAVDGHRKMVVLFGGSTTGGQISDATWILDIAKKEWEKAKLKESPVARTHHNLVFLPELNHASNLISLAFHRGDFNDGQSCSKGQC